MHPCCEPLWQLSPVTGSTRYQADVENGTGQAVQECCPRVEGSVVGKILSVCIRHHEGSFCLNMPNMNL